MGWSYPRIGKRFNRDHTTVIHGVRKADPETVERLYNAVNSAKVAEQQSKRNYT
jgi:chromosomal replication initiation ATPase DnaA